MAKGKAAVRVEENVADVADTVNVTDIGCGGHGEHSELGTRGIQ